MVAVQGELRAAHPVHPLQLPVYLAARPLLGVRSGQDAAGLVRVQDGLLEQRSFELRFEVREVIRSQLEVQSDGTVAGTRSAQRLENLCGAFQWHEVSRIQVDRQSMYSGAVLHPAGDLIWESSMLPVRTPRADLHLRAVLGHLQAKLRQAARPLLGVRSGQEVMNLPFHMVMDVNAVPGLSTGTLSGQRNRDHLVCMLRHLERLSHVTTLSARRPTGLLALTLRFPRLVLTRRPTGGPAVLS